jgi:hypothetical protein
MTSKKLVYVTNIIAALPALLIVPLVPFIFILIVGEGRIPGFFHEYALRALMVLYPITLIACVVGSIRLLRRNRTVPAFWISLCPLVVFILLAATFWFGGVVLR